MLCRNCYRSIALTCLYNFRRQVWLWNLNNRTMWWQKGFDNKSWMFKWNWVCSSQRINPEAKYRDDCMEFQHNSFPRKNAWNKNTKISWLYHFSPSPEINFCQKYLTRNVRILLISGVSNQRRQAKSRLGIYDLNYALAISMQLQFQARENVYAVALQIWKNANWKRI